MSRGADVGEESERLLSPSSSPLSPLPGAGLGIRSGAQPDTEAGLQNSPSQQGLHSSGCGHSSSPVGSCAQAAAPSALVVVAAGVLITLVSHWEALKQLRVSEDGPVRKRHGRAGQCTLSFAYALHPLTAFPAPPFGPFSSAPQFRTSCPLYGTPSAQAPYAQVRQHAWCACAWLCA